MEKRIRLNLCLAFCLALALPGHAQDGMAVVDAFNERAWSFYAKQPDSIIAYGLWALESAEKNHYEKGRVVALTRLSRGYTETGAYEQAKLYCHQAIEAAQRIREPRYQASASLQLAIIELRETRYAEALDHALKALTLYESAGDQSGAVMAYTRIGQVYNQTKRFDQAIETFRKGLQIAVQINDKQTSAYLNGELATAYKNQAMDKGSGDFAPAIRHFNRAIALFSELGINEVWITYLGLSDLYAEGLGDTAKALQYGQKALEIVGKTGDRYGSCQVLTTLARRLNEVGKPVEANRALRQAQALAEQEQFVDLLPVIYLERGLAFSESPHPDSAQYYLQAYGFALENRLRQTYDHKLAELETKYETAEKEKLLLTLQNEKNSLDLRLQRQHSEILEQHLLSSRKDAAIESLEQEKRIQALNLAQQEGKTRESQLIASRRTAELQVTRERALAWRNGLFALAASALALFIGIWQYLRFRRIRREQQLNLEFARQKAELETRTLRAQMNPHFIFNALASIKKFVLTNDTDNAEAYLSKFARLIRLILENSRETLATLQSEIELLDHYISLECLRSGNRFDYNFHYAGDIAPENIEIPSLVLQPYVENAIVHGLNNRTEPGGQLLIAFTQTEDSLFVRIEDNGVGRLKAQAMKNPNQAIHHRSYGLDITQKRLEAFAGRFGRTPRVTITDLENEWQQACGTRVDIEIPVFDN